MRSLLNRHLRLTHQMKSADSQSTSAKASQSIAPDSATPSSSSRKRSKRQATNNSCTAVADVSSSARKVPVAEKLSSDLPYSTQQQQQQQDHVGWNAANLLLYNRYQQQQAQQAQMEMPWGTSNGNNATSGYLYNPSQAAAAAAYQFPSQYAAAAMMRHARPSESQHQQAQQQQQPRQIPESAGTTHQQYSAFSAAMAARLFFTQQLCQLVATGWTKLHVPTNAAVPRSRHDPNCYQRCLLSRRGSADNSSSNDCDNYSSIWISVFVVFLCIILGCCHRQSGSRLPGPKLLTPTCYYYVCQQHRCPRLTCRTLLSFLGLQYAFGGRTSRHAGFVAILRTGGLLSCCLSGCLAGRFPNSKWPTSTPASTTTASSVGFCATCCLFTLTTLVSFVHTRAQNSIYGFCY
uniref:Zinc finger protein 432 n=1 Tax=Schistocephalus solidus TaxID=70667 RepID=A0A0X3PSA8_SCHSO